MRRVLALAGLAVALAGHPAAAGEHAAQKTVRPLADFSAAIEELAQTASPAVVQITVRSRAPIDEDGEKRTGYVAEHRSRGSGVIVGADGYIVTNAHVIQGARSIDVSVIDRAAPDRIDDHKHYAGKLAGVDAETDLALLKIEGHNLPTLSFADSDKLKQGQIVIALGSPLGLENSLTVGFVSAPVRHLGSESPMFYIQTDAPINPGNSGGPLLDIEGRIAGINTMILTQSGGSEGIGLAIPSNIARQVCQRLRADGVVRRGTIGVMPQDITPILAGALGLDHHTGVILSDIKPHGAAEAAGIQAGDIVLALNGKPLKESRQLTAIVFQSAPGDQITVDLQRGTERFQKVVTVLERPNTPSSLAELAQQGQVVRALGILALTVDEKVTGILGDLRRLSGVAVAAIPAEYAALNPGLASGDVIYEVNGKRVTSVDELNAEMAGKKSGDPVAMLVERDGVLIYVSFEVE